tara:strand:+ start:250 stop:459 length:210 start_codon:yes stop_codon:yes gene_type:complete
VENRLVALTLVDFQVELFPQVFQGVPLQCLPVLPAQQGLFLQEELFQEVSALFPLVSLHQEVEEHLLVQ